MTPLNKSADRHSMKKELRLAISNLVRHYTRVRMDNLHLLGIVMQAQHTGKLPDMHSVTTWLREMRDLPESRAVLQDTEELLAGVFQTVDEDALTGLISMQLKDD